MIFGNHSNLKKIGGTTGFFVLCVGLYLSLRTQAPLFEGHTMEWWLNDFSQTSFRSGPHVTERQKKAIEAFHHFGKQGLEFLLDEMSMPRGFISRYKIKLTKKLRQASWGKFLGFKQRASRGEQAGFLFRHLEFPLERTEVQLNQLNSADYYEMYYATVVLRQATNHQADIIRSMGPFLNHTNASWTSLAAGTIAKLYQKTDTVQELADYLPGMPPIRDTTALMTILETLSAKICDFSKISSLRIPVRLMNFSLILLRYQYAFNVHVTLPLSIHCHPLLRVFAPPRLCYKNRQSLKTS